MIDPDSRLTQLGFCRCATEDRYRLFESRPYGGASEDTCRRWRPNGRTKPSASRTRRRMSRWGGPQVRAGPLDPPLPYIAVSLGVGENPAKRIADPFEQELLRLLATRAPLVIDKGAGGEEAARVERPPSGGNATFWDGSFAGFAADHRGQQSVRGLRFRRAARGGRLRGSADQHFRGLSRAADVPPLAPDRSARHA